MTGRDSLRRAGAARRSSRAPRPRNLSSRRHAWRRAAPFFVLALAVLALAAAPHPASAAGIPRWTPNGVAICTATGIQQNPQLVGDGAGGAIVTWQDRRGNSLDDIYAQHVMAGGAVDPAWPLNGVALCVAPFNQSQPQIASDGAGGAIVVWSDGRNSGIIDIYAQHVLASGAVDPVWPVDGAVVCAAAGAQGLPQIVTDGAGGAFVAWQDPRGATSDIYAQHMRADGTPDPAWPVDGAAVCVMTRVQTNPRMITDGAGGAIITWQDSRSSNPSFDIYDIYAQRLLASGAVAPGWPANGVALCTNIGNQLFPEIATDGAGGAIVTWYDRRSGQPADPIFQDIFAQRVSAAGVPLWTPDGVALCRAVSTQQGQVIVADGAGGAIVAWQDFRSDVSYDIYAQHVRADSTIAPGWPANGAPVCVASSSQENPRIVTDGAGGAIITWYNVISPPSFGPIYRDIYAQRVLANGAIAAGWPADGLVVCSADSTQQTPQLTPDGSGGAIVTWQDWRKTGANPQDIYAQRINDTPCPAPGDPGLWTLESCGVVDWTDATGGLFSDIANWNGGAGPVPNGTCPASCTLYDARFGIGGAAYGVDFTADATSASVTVAGGDHAAFHLAGHTYGVGDVRVAGAGSRLTIAGGAVAVNGTIQIGPAANVITGATPAGAPSGASFRIDAAGTATLSGVAGTGDIVFTPGGALVSAAPIPYDLTNSGTLSPGAVSGGAGMVESSASYTQSPGATLAIDLGGAAPGTGYDALRVAGQATLAGTLTWKLVGGYVPTIGQPFEVLIAHPRTGVFDSVAVDIGVSYTDTSVVLVTIPATPALASLAGAEAEPGRVKVRWWVSGTASPVGIERARSRGGWAPLALEFPDGTGIVSLMDTDVTPGRYGYRLRLRTDGAEITAGEVWVDVPAASVFALRGVSPNPAHGPLTVAFSLDAAEPAALELYDLAGRRLDARAIEAPRPGNRLLTLAPDQELGPGVYLLWLSQGARRASYRFAVVR